MAPFQFLLFDATFGLSPKTVAKHGHLSHEDQKLRKAYFLAQMLKKKTKVDIYLCFG